jgi:peptidoglycan/LPS O-acetylase OafA/YrhL
LLDNIYGLLLIIGILAFEKAKFPFFNFFSWLGSKTFGIFLIHAIVIEYLARLIYRFIPRVLAYQIIFQPVLVVFGLGIPLLLMVAVDKSPLRRFYAYLFG